MSHHLDSPLARQDPRLDITDLYVFRGEVGTVLVLNVCHSLAEVAVPGFQPEGRYEFKIDLDGDAVEDLTYRFSFGARDAAGRQRLQVESISGAAAGEVTADGTALAAGVTGEEIVGGGLRIWAGPAGDPFWIEPDVLHALGHAVQDGTRLELGGWTPAAARNLFAGQTVYSIVLEIAEDDQLASSALDARIGVWSVAWLATDAGGWRSINRAGLPMIHPLFAQFNEGLGDLLNSGRPADDFASYGEVVIEKIAGIVGAYGTTADPSAYAERVAHRLLPNILPYTVGTAAVFGFAEVNGRSLIDNAPDVMFSLAANTPISLGIGRESVTRKPLDRFPYVPPLS